MLPSKESKWEIFKIPCLQTIQYYSILKRKKEFSQLIEQFEAQVRQHGSLHYCSIVPKPSSLNDESELLIVFLGDVPSTSFIGFRVYVNNETFIQESNSLILFLKQSEKARLYFVNSNCIHVQCGKDAWEIFYHLYGIYLKKHVLTVIGTQFFNDFVYRLCFQNEKQLLSMLFRGSKVIRVSKKSIYYQMHQKHKISVTDLIHMTLNMPESKKCVLSFDSKESHSQSNIVDQNIYTGVGSTNNCFKLVLNKFKKQHQESLLDNREIPLENVSNPLLNFHLQFKEDIENEKLIVNSSMKKRKFQAPENEFQRHSSSSKFPKLSDCVKGDKNWELYTSLYPYSLKSYSSLLPSKSIISGLFDNTKLSSEVDSLYASYCNDFFPSFHNCKSSLVYLVKNSPALKETCDINNVQNPNRNSLFDGNSKSASRFREKNIMKECQKNASSESLPSAQILHCENLALQSLSLSKHMDQKEANDIFTTAAGKSINISKDAMLAAQKLIQDVCQDQKLDCSSFENKEFVKVPALKPKSIISCSASKEEGEVDSSSSSELSDSYDRGTMSFYTAAGKTIKTSKAAMKSAHKLIKDAFEKEDKIIPSSSGTSIKRQTLKDIGGPPKKLSLEVNEDTMDRALVEKFFQDAIFDEKKSEDSTEFSKAKHFRVSKNNELAKRKIKKSLGGRRSMRFFSNT